MSGFGFTSMENREQEIKKTRRKKRVKKRVKKREKRRGKKRRKKNCLKSPEFKSNKLQGRRLIESFKTGKRDPNRVLTSSTNSHTAKSPKASRDGTPSNLTRMI